MEKLAMLVLAVGWTWWAWLDVADMQRAAAAKEVSQMRDYERGRSLAVRVGSKSGSGRHVKSSGSPDFVATSLTQRSSRTAGNQSPAGRLRHKPPLSALTNGQRRMALVTKAGATGATLHPTSIPAPYQGGPPLFTTRMIRTIATSTITISTSTVSAGSASSSASTSTATSTLTTPSTTGPSTTTQDCSCRLTMAHKCSYHGPCAPCCQTGLTCNYSPGYPGCGGPYCCLPGAAA